MNNPVYSGLLTLEISKIVMYEFWYGYVEPWRKSKIRLNGYGYFHCSCRNRRHL